MADASLKNFIIDGSERSVQDIVSKLKFMSKIKEGEIVDVASLSLMERGWKTSAYRTFVARGENRMATLEFFRHVIGEAFDLATKYLQNPEKFFQDIGEMIIIALQESKAGIANYKKTYASDQMYVARVETLMKTVDTKSNDLHRKIMTRDYPDAYSETTSEVYTEETTYSIPFSNNLMKAESPKR